MKKLIYLILVVLLLFSGCVIEETISRPLEIKELGISVYLETYIEHGEPFITYMRGSIFSSTRPIKMSWKAFKPFFIRQLDNNISVAQIDRALKYMSYYLK